MSQIPLWICRQASFHSFGHSSCSILAYRRIRECSGENEANVQIVTVREHTECPFSPRIRLGTNRITHEERIREQSSNAESKSLSSENPIGHTAQGGGATTKNNTYLLAAILIAIVVLLAGCTQSQEKEPNQEKEQEEEQEKGEITLSTSSINLDVFYPSTWAHFTIEGDDTASFTLENTYREAKTVSLQIQNPPEELTLSLSDTTVVVPGQGSSTVSLTLSADGFSHETKTSTVIVAQGSTEVGRITVNCRSHIPSPEETLMGYLSGHSLTRDSSVSYQGYDGHTRDLAVTGDWTLLFQTAAVEQTVFDCGTIQAAKALVEGALSTEVEIQMNITSAVTKLVGFGLNQLTRSIVPLSDELFKQEFFPKESYKVNGRDGYRWRSQIRFQVALFGQPIYGKNFTDVETVVWNDGCYVYEVSGGPFADVENLAGSLPAPIPHEGSPELTDSYWQFEGQSISEAYLNQPIEGFVKIKAVGGYLRKPVTMSVWRVDMLEGDKVIETATTDLDLDSGEEYLLGTGVVTPGTRAELYLTAEYGGREIWRMDDHLVTEEADLEVPKDQMYFELGGTKVSQVVIGAQATAKATISCTKGYASGDVEIQVWKDIGNDPLDQLYEAGSATYAVRQGQSQEISYKFTAAEATESEALIFPYFKGYYIKVLFPRGLPVVMEDKYPPRITVLPSEQPTPKGTLERTDAYFLSQGARTTQVELATDVYAHVTLQAKGGRCQGTLELSVRKDGFIFSEEIQKRTFSYDLQDGQSRDFSLQFSPPTEGTYFICVKYDSTSLDISSPKLNVVLSGRTEVTDAYFQYQGKRVTEVAQGSQVMVCVSFGSTSGGPVSAKNLVVSVWKDISLSDDVMVASSGPFELSGSTGLNKCVSFTASDKTGSGGLLSTFRGYYIQVEWDGGSYKMDDGYPPRLRVT